MSEAADPGGLPPVLAWAELMQLLGLSRTWIRALIARPDFPTPIAELSVGRIWSTKDVLAYCEREGRQTFAVRRPSES